MNKTVTRNELQARQLGYANVAVYAGGKEDWKEEVAA